MLRTLQLEIMHYGSAQQLSRVKFLMRTNIQSYLSLSFHEGFAESARLTAALRHIENVSQRPS